MMFILERYTEQKKFTVKIDKSYRCGIHVYVNLNKYIRIHGTEITLYTLGIHTTTHTN
jgi:hypothetical protein